MDAGIDAYLEAQREIDAGHRARRGAAGLVPVGKRLRSERQRGAAAAGELVQRLARRALAGVSGSLSARMAAPTARVS